MVQFLPVVVRGGIVVIELLALEARSQAVGAGDYPLEIGAGVVVSGRRVDDGIVGVAITPGREGVHGGADQFRQMLFQQIKADGRIGGVDMGMAAVEAGAVELLLPLGARHPGGIPLLGLGDAGALGQLAEIVEIGRQPDPGGGRQSFIVHDRFSCNTECMSICLLFKPSP